MFRRREVKTHGRLMRDELNESIEHLRMAASHAAGGAAGALAPRVDAARAAVKPGLRKVRGSASGGVSALLSAAGNSKRGAKGLTRKSKTKVTKKESVMAGRRWPVVLGGLVIAGAAAGAVGALVKRRRAQRSWDQYDSTRHSTDKSMIDSAKTSMDAGIGRVSSAASSAKDRATDLIGSGTQSGADQLSRETSTISSTGTSARPGEFKQQKDDMFAKPSPASTSSSITGSKNSRT